MKKQFFLQVLKDKLEKQYLLKKRSIDVRVCWTPDSLMELSVIIENYVMNNYGVFREVLDKKSIDVIVSVSSLDRIFKSGEQKLNGELYEEYNVEEPLRPVKRQILDILCKFLRFKNWDDFVYIHSIATTIIDEIDAEVKDMVKDEFYNFKNEHRRSAQSNNPALNTHQRKSFFISGFTLNFATDAIKWGWTINTEGNSSTCEINSINFMGIGEDPKVAIFHLTMTFYLSVHSQTTLEFIEDVIIETTERVYAQKADGKWYYKCDNIALLVRWLKCSRKPDVLLHQANVIIDENH